MYSAFSQATYFRHEDYMVIDTKTFRLQMTMVDYGGSDHAVLIGLLKLLKANLIRPVNATVICLEVDQKSSRIRIGDFSFPASEENMKATAYLLEKYLAFMSEIGLHEDYLGVVTKLDIPDFLANPFKIDNGFLNIRMRSATGTLKKSSMRINKEDLQELKSQAESATGNYVQLRVETSVLHLSRMYIQDLLSLNV